MVLAARILLKKLVPLSVGAYKAIPDNFLQSNLAWILIFTLCAYNAFVFIDNLNLFFCLAATFIVIPYIASMVTLLFIQDEWRSKQNYITVIGIMTGLVIVFFALQDLMPI